MKKTYSAKEIRWWEIRFSIGELQSLFRSFHPSVSGGLAGRAPARLTGVLHSSPNMGRDCLGRSLPMHVYGRSLFVRDHTGWWVSFDRQAVLPCAKTITTILVVKKRMNRHPISSDPPGRSTEWMFSVQNVHSHASCTSSIEMPGWLPVLSGLVLEENSNKEIYVVRVRCL